ncbi:MAG TPA: hypothetical protein VGS12_01670 [Caulobacteraceae bacterium]|nr:hypothetical protein [Caulobacteraceae bacterium]
MEWLAGAGAAGDGAPAAQGGRVQDHVLSWAGNLMSWFGARVGARGNPEATKA